MTNPTCSELDCDGPIKARTLCGRHYGIAYRGGTLPPSPKKRHSLSNADIESATAICTICGPVGIRVRRDGRSPECMTTRKEAMMRRSHGRYTYDAAIKYKYGLSRDRYDEMMHEQNGLCAICGNSPKRMVVDHNHKTGAVRQLLCQHCNSALGFIKDDVNTARAAIEYLLRHARAA